MAGKLYADIAGRRIPLVPTGLWTFTAACDVALNPPLPPIVPAGSQRVTWADIYPPYRFRRIVAAMRGIKTELGPESTHDDYVSLVSEICDAAGLDHYQSYAPQLCGYQGVDWLAACATETGQDRPAGTFPTEDYSYFDYLLWCIERAWDLRRRNLPMLATSGWQRTTGRLGTLPLLFEDEGAGWLTAPLWAIGDRYGYTQRLKVPFGSWLSVSAAIHASTFDLMTATDNATLNAAAVSVRSHHADRHVFRPDSTDNRKTTSRRSAAVRVRPEISTLATGSTGCRGVGTRPRVGTRPSPGARAGAVG